MTKKNWIFGLMAVAAAFAFLTVGGHIVAGNEASANNCQAKCQAEENSCRKVKGDDPSCDAAMKTCLEGCRGK